MPELIGPARQLRQAADTRKLLHDIAKLGEVRLILPPKPRGVVSIFRIFVATMHCLANGLFQKLVALDFFLDNPYTC